MNGVTLSESVKSPPPAWLLAAWTNTFPPITLTASSNEAVTAKKVPELGPTINGVFWKWIDFIELAIPCWAPCDPSLANAFNLFT